MSLQSGRYTEVETMREVAVSVMVTRLSPLGETFVLMLRSLTGRGASLNRCNVTFSEPISSDNLRLP